MYPASQLKRVGLGIAVFAAVYWALYFQMSWSGLAVWALAFWVPIVAVRLTFWVPRHRWVKLGDGCRKFLGALLAVVWFTALAAVVAALPMLTPQVIVFPLWVAVGGFAALAVGAVVMVWSVSVLGWRKLLALPVIQGGGENPNSGGLVVAGPYARMRHPLYFSELLHLGGVFLISGVVPVFMLIAAWLCLVFLIIRAEESELTARFGKHYRAYCRKAGMLLPKW